MCRFAYTVNPERLRELWEDENWTQADIARDLCLTRRQLEDAIKRHSLGPRARCHRAFSMDGEEDGDCANESLSLSPWVAARIKELRLGMPA